jgi:hypothetical protein
MRSLTAFAARRAATLVAVVIIAPSVTYLFSAVTRDGRSLGQAMRGLAEYLHATFVRFDLGGASVNGIDMPVGRVLVEGCRSISAWCSEAWSSVWRSAWEERCCAGPVVAPAAIASWASVRRSR